MTTKKEPEEQPERKYLNYKEMKALLDIVKDTPDEKLLIRLLSNGLAPRDVVRIRAKSFKYGKGLLRFKGKDGIKRECDIDLPTLAFAQKYVSDEGVDKTDTLFDWNERRVHDIVTENGELAGLGKNITPTLLRDTWVFTAIRNGKNIDYIHKQLGNTDRQYTTELVNGFAAIDRYTQPKVCIYIPVHEAKKPVVEDTLKAVAALDYTNYTTTALVNNSSPEFVKWLTEVAKKYNVAVKDLGVIEAKEEVILDGKTYIAIMEQGGIFSITKQVRNAARDLFCKSDGEYAAMCDSDCPPKSFAIKRCLKYFRDQRWKNVGIVSGIVFLRFTKAQGKGGKVGYRPAVHFSPERPNAKEVLDFFLKNWTEMEVFEVDGVGMGWTVISREVLDKVAFDLPKDLNKFMGEDFYFCKLARAAGFLVMCVMDIIADHLETELDIKKYRTEHPEPIDMDNLPEVKPAKFVVDQVNGEFTSEFYDEEYFEDGLTAHKSGYGGYYNHPLFEAIAKELVNYFKPKKVLDVGAAKGHLVGELVKRDADAHGIDLSKYAVEHCEEELRERLTCGSATKLPYPDKSFDLVVTFDMMEHLSEAQYRAAIKEIGRAASKDILFSITTEDNVHDKSHVSIMPIQKWIEIIEQEIGTEFYRHKNNFLDQGILWFTPKMCVIYSRKR